MAVSFLLLLIKVFTNKSVAGTLGSVLLFELPATKRILHSSPPGVSLKTLEAYALVFAARLTSILVGTIRATMDYPSFH